MMVNYMSDVAEEMSWKSDKIRRDFAQHRLSAYSPDFTADEAVWDWAREEVTANECLGTKAKVQEKMYVFFGGLAHRKDEVKHRCRTLLQARADALMMKTATPLPSLQNVVPTLALV